jgi:hypothetical protein
VAHLIRLLRCWKAPEKVRGYEPPLISQLLVYIYINFTVTDIYIYIYIYIYGRMTVQIPVC